MTNEELKKTLENHQHWLNEDIVGWEGLRADLEGVDLRGADLRGVDLRLANLARADLTSAKLEGAKLEGANLEGAKLEGANLEGAYISDANLKDTDLRNTNLAYAILELSYLRNANLECSYLRGAYLKDADFRCADLKGADLRGADLRGANFIKTKNVPFIPMACPDEGGFIGWKKAGYVSHNTVSWVAIIKLYIPEDAKRSSANGRKCRCNKAKVLDIELLATGEKVSTAFSHYDPAFVYIVGECVEVDNFDEDRFNECAPGIHFFINKQEAIDY